MRTKSRFVAASLLVALAMGVTAPAKAVPMSLFIPGNDCSGVFGSGFSNCRVGGSPPGVPGVPGSPLGSPSIIKYGPLGEVEEISVNFPLFDPDQISLVIGTGVGSFEYDRGPADPAVMFWAAKAGDGFILHWDEVGGVPVAVTSGEWETPEGKALSHITFYDTGEFPPVPPEEVPEPLSLLLLGAGLLGLGFARRRIATS